MQSHMKHSQTTPAAGGTPQQQKHKANNGTLFTATIHLLHRTCMAACNSATRLSPGAAAMQCVPVVPDTTHSLGPG